jgi:hypothetical protein
VALVTSPQSAQLTARSAQIRIRWGWGARTLAARRASQSAVGSGKGSSNSSSLCDYPLNQWRKHE